MTALAEAFAARASDDRPGCTFEGRTTPWTRIVAESATRAEILQHFLDSTRQRRFAILTEDSSEYMFWLGAALAGNACVTGLDSMRPPDVNASVLRSSRSQFVVADDGGLALLDTLDIPPVRVVDLKSAHYLAILEGGESTSSHIPQREGLLCSMIIESDSLGHATFDVTDKLVSSAANEVVRATELTSHDICYTALPLSKAKTVLACWGPAVLTGAEIVFGSSFSSDGFMSEVREFNCTFFVFKGSMITALLQRPDDDADRDHRLRVGYGTGSTPAQRLEFHERYGCELIDVDIPRPGQS